MRPKQLEKQKEGLIDGFYATETTGETKERSYMRILSDRNF
ncbi:hypothetical protein AA0X95_18590 [Bacillus sp. 1P10SD]